MIGYKRYFFTLTQSGNCSDPNNIRCPSNSPAPFFRRSSIRKSPLFRFLGWLMINRLCALSPRCFLTRRSLSVQAEGYIYNNNLIKYIEIAGNPDTPIPSLSNKKSSFLRNFAVEFPANETNCHICLRQRIQCRTYH